MSLITKDFRLHKQPARQRGYVRLRWTLLAIAGAGIGAVIASTSTGTSNSAVVATDTLPAFESVATTSDELARDSFSLSLPELQAQQKIIDDANNLTPKKWREFKVKSGDNLAHLFKRAKIKPQQLDELMKSGDAVKTLTSIYPKDIIRVLSDDEGKLQALRYDIDHKSYLMVERESGVLVAKTYNHQLETRSTHASGVIDSSLFLAAQDAGISQNIIMELANIFGWDIDFALDIRKGDSFTLLYEEIYRNGEKISDGDILAAEFVNDGKSYRAVRYTNPQTNNTEYFTPNGKSMRKAFLRSPVEFSRISSRFSLGRKHPILNKIRAHKGVDYAASRGTPIKSTGDGKIIFKGNKGGYGKTIIIKHGSAYSTLYAHMRSYNKKSRKGSRVKQGQVIGYIGSTGLATGPHLHFEFRVNGAHRNPLTVRLPKASPLPGKYRPDFDQKAREMVAKLDLIKSSSLALLR